LLNELASAIKFGHW